MDYSGAIQYLDSFLNYEKIGYKNKIEFKLEGMRELSHFFGNPQDSFPSVHIAGTKGKGSIASFVSGILEEAGFNVGLYTSPHLVTVLERIKVNNRMIEENQFALLAAEFKSKLDSANLKFSPTFFEAVTMLAFNYFRKRKIDIAVVEAGLGGRLDATNILRPLVSAISPISYDHTEVLGGTIEKIAFEKIEIIKKECVSVSAPQPEGALGQIRKRCADVGSRLILVGADIRFKEICHTSEKEIFDVYGLLDRYGHCISYLVGRHQIENAASAIGIAEALAEKNIVVSTDHIKRGIEKTRHEGRCEIFDKDPYVILDGAQNRESAKALIDAIKRNFTYRRLVLVMGVCKGKDVKGICEELIPCADDVILTKADVPRAENPRLIEKFIKEKHPAVKHSVREALRAARRLANPEDLILVTGSFFVIGEVKRNAGRYNRSFIHSGR